MRRTRRITRRAATRSPAACIVIVTEGASTEPAYLRTFGRIYGEPSAVRLDIIPAAGDPRAVVERAITELRKLRGNKLASRDTVWAMFDRDEHPRFDEARILARDNGISMAISNPCFELWGIFHYRDYDAPLDQHQCQRQLSHGTGSLYWLKLYLPLVLHHRLRQHREDAGALHHLSGIRRSAVVRVGGFPGTGNRSAHRAVTPEPCAVRPLPDSRAVMAGARPVRLPAGSGHRPGVAAVADEQGQHREPAQRDEVGSRRVRQRGCGSG